MTRFSYTSWGGAVQRELITDWEQPYVLAQRTQVVLPDIFFERNKALGEEQTGSMKLVARVPMTVYETAVHEGWADDEAAWTRWLNDPDNAAFRVWKGRV